MHQDLVSIIIPTYNAEKNLAETIKSAINQTWKNKEIILVDDGSTDRSLTIANQFSENGLIIISQKNKGAAAARNLGIKKAKGNFFQFLDADDLLSPNKIELQMKEISAFTGKISLSNSIHFFEDSDPLTCSPSKTDVDLFKSTKEPADFLLNLYGRKGNGGIVPIHAWLMHRGLLDKAGYWNESLSLDDDGEYFCRVVLASEEVVFVQHTNAYYRKYKSNKSLSAQNNFKAFQSAYKTLNLKEEHFKKYKGKDFYAKTFAASYYKLGIQCYPKYNTLSSQCIERAKYLDQKYKHNKQYIGGRISNYIANNISWKLARHLQNIKSTIK
ncbi:Glycosyltransferase involved in cell wall bisynthesis [Pedobacter terrae]|uniref:Glycosyltransferase involved in cell wall bisynthesis n=1 Tax=Pedobacter terrae TaxID=405671 RepID=A0A1G7U442_9SPHI|nr:glycosyltransferase family 2 protein [Pedobacter terrae]SDG42148.1 Glycosyltransferase involved in cell wall bisynthesis [Pedobacter terrae]